VNITSTIALTKNVTLTASHWVQLVAIHKQVDIEVKKCSPIFLRHCDRSARIRVAVNELLRPADVERA